MENFFKEGDVVQLKSGGPLMTISTLFNTCGVEMTICVYIVHGELLIKEELPACVLKLAENSQHI